MTNKRAEYLYKFTGIIQKKTRRVNPKHAQYFYQLNAKLAGYFHPQKLFAFKNKSEPTIWTALETDEFVGKQYLFSCRNYQGSYYLVDWEEVDHE